jgi:hypothetical protein
VWIHQLKQKSILMMNIPIVQYGSMDLDSLEMLQDIAGTLQVKVPDDSLAKVNGMKKVTLLRLPKTMLKNLLELEIQTKIILHRIDLLVSRHTMKLSM